MSYKNKLNNFNHTQKYASEIEFLNGMLPNKGRILDYGCGTGTGAVMLRTKGRTIDGYDVTSHNESFKYVQNTDDFYDAVYFMHSLAHISDPLNVLKQQRRWIRTCDRVIVITPNLDWLNSKGSKGYKPDPTVVNHFCQYRLEQLFLDAGYSIVNSGQFGARLGNHNERLFLVAKKNKYKNVK